MSSCFDLYKKRTRQNAKSNMTSQKQQNVGSLRYVKKFTQDEISIDLLRPQSRNLNYEINYDSGVLQEGAFGKIYKAIEISTGVNLAAKIIKKTKDNAEQLETEVFIMDCLNGKKYIIPKVFVAEDENFLIIYMEEKKGGDVFSYFNKFERFDECLSFVIFYQILEALNTMHNLKINHRDIKLENVVFDNENDMNCFLLDFGLSEFWTNEKNPSSISRGGSIKCAAPEVFTADTNRPINGMRADYFSLGVVLFLMTVGEYPFFDTDEDDEDNDIKNALTLIYSRKVYGSKIFDKLDEDLQLLILKLISPDPLERYTYDEIIKNEWYIKQKENLYFKGCPKKNIITKSGVKKNTPAYVKKKFFV